jgi:hypothetical protein
MAVKNETGQLVSPYQWGSSTSWIESGVGVLDTAGSLPVQIVRIEREEELNRLLEQEQVQIRIPAARGVEAFYVLARMCRFVALQNEQYVLLRRDLRHLDYAGIPYDIVG